MTPYYTRCFDKGKLFIRGRKPKQLAEIAKITERQWEMYQNHLNRKNPILIGLRYLKVFEQESITSYARAAQVLGVSRIRVYQLTSLVTRLPAEITEFLLENSNDPAILRTFTERRLRPLTALPTKRSQLAEFRTLLGRIPDPNIARVTCNVRPEGFDAPRYTGACSGSAFRRVEGSALSRSTGSRPWRPAK